MVPKTGVTSYTAMMIQYSDNFIQHFPNKTAFDVYGYSIYFHRNAQNGLYEARNMSPVQLKEALLNYYKIITSRHPFSRLYSYYKNKIVGEKCFHIISGRVLKYTRNITLTNAKDTCNVNITFEEFIRYFRNKRDLDWETHVKRINEQCSVSKIDYDTFIRTETASTDQQFVMDTFLSKSDPSAPRVDPFETNVKTSINKGYDLRLTAYDRLDPSDITWLEQYYQKDLDMFGYSVKHDAHSLMAKCSIGNDSDRCC